MNGAFAHFVLLLVKTHPKTTVADVLERIVLERLYITIEGQDAFSLDELAEIERNWMVLIRRF